MSDLVFVRLTSPHGGTVILHVNKIVAVEQSPINGTLVHMADCGISTIIVQEEPEEVWNILQEN